MIAGHFQGCRNNNDQIWHNVNTNVKLNVYTYTLLCADQWRVYCRDNRREIAVIAEIREPEGTTDKKTQKYPYVHRHQVLYLSNLVDRRVHADDDAAITIALSSLDWRFQYVKLFSEPTLTCAASKWMTCILITPALIAPNSSNCDICYELIKPISGAI